MASTKEVLEHHLKCFGGRLHRVIASTRLGDQRFVPFTVSGSGRIGPVARNLCF